MSARDEVLECAGAVISAWRETLLDSVPAGLEESIVDLRAAVERMNEESHARATDPETSKQGPVSYRMNQSRSDVLRTLRLRPLTDIELVSAMSPKMSASGARSRRAELVRMGLVKDTGKRRRSSTGRLHAVWEVV
mgnify:CR=1|tara:strand:+ start:227 stop:634 length:408 start_codon:yes stop_codon:yes gene_type:complete